jgi:hypothetical protein
MSILAILLALLTLISFNIGCEKQKEEKVTPSPSPVAQTPTPKESAAKENQIIARVNGKPIFREDLSRKGLNQAIMNEIFYQEGLRTGVDKSVEDKVEKYKRELVVGIIIGEYLDALPDLQKVSDEEIERYYEDREKTFDYVRIQQVTVTDNKIAEDIMQRAKDGEDLAKIAKELSVPIKTSGIKPNVLAKKNIFSTIEVGSLSDIVEDGGTYKIFKIIAIGSYPLSKFKSIIISKIKSQKRSQALQEYMDQIIKDNNIKVETFVDKDGK